MRNLTLAFCIHQVDSCPALTVDTDSVLQGACHSCARGRSALRTRLKVRRTQQNTSEIPFFAKGKSAGAPIVHLNSNGVFIANLPRCYRMAPTDLKPVPGSTSAGNKDAPKQRRYLWHRLIEAFSCAAYWQSAPHSAIRQQPSCLWSPRTRHHWIWFDCVRRMWHVQIRILRGYRCWPIEPL